MSSDFTDYERVLELEDGDAQPLSIRAKALVFSDPVSRSLHAYLEQVAPSEAPILITGETGTGKELAARHIHEMSRRRGPFVAVNCGAISENLADSEWFGHEAGSFTGAIRRREGWFESANGGTLFLDEIGDLPLSMQVKLLRVLQEREVVRVGSRRPQPVDIRLVAATNVDLEDAVRAGHFRLDLFYRLNIAQVRLPPLRERPGDILPLARHFLERYGRKLDLPPQRLSPLAERALVRYQWPGNIRELENVIHFALLVASSEEIGPEHLKLNGAVGVTGDAELSVPGGAPASELSPLDQIEAGLLALYRQGGPGLYEAMEKRIIDSAFAYSRYNQVRTAALLGISRNVLRTLLKRHGHLGSVGDGADAALELTGRRAAE